MLALADRPVERERRVGGDVHSLDVACATGQRQLLRPEQGDSRNRDRRMALGGLLLLCFSLRSRFGRSTLLVGGRKRRGEGWWQRRRELDAASQRGRLEYVAASAVRVEQRRVQMHRRRVGALEVECDQLYACRPKGQWVHIG
jgi:hypothetical protein